MAATLGVDVGGTFTDFYLLRDGRLEVFKRPSTPDDPSRAVLAGLDEGGFLPEELVHGSTVATNALLERRGARTALVTTRGFRDAIVIGRQARREMYALEPTRSEPLVPSDRRFEVNERIDSAGCVLMQLGNPEVQTVAEMVAASGAESAAVCLLFSFLHPEHERRVAEALRARGLFVSASVEVLPEYREYERMSTTTVNAYVSPVMARYLHRLQVELERAGVRRLRVMQSDGGSLAAHTAGVLAVRTVLSGPAGGVAGAFASGRAAGYTDLITFDMGGTSTDVSLCPGRVQYRTDLSIEGLPVRTPAVDIHTVGAGGGSVAWLDAGGALRVGPQSAGADPGPACYGKGDGATVTDAQLALGRLRPEHFLGGRMRIEPEAARKAVAALGTAHAETGLDSVAAAIVRVANANMERAIRVISVERGHDPRAFSLLAFGGAGPLHACDLAEALRIPRVIVPRHPGVLSAFGMVMADVTRDYVAPVLRGMGDAPDLAAVVAEQFEAMEVRGRKELAESGFDTDTLMVERSLDLRYAGQSYEVEIQADAGDPPAWTDAFHRAHAARYGHGHPGRSVEIVNARVRLRLPQAQRVAPPAPPSDARGEPIGYARIWFGTRRRTPVYGREGLSPRLSIDGPAVVVQMDTTTVVNPGWRLAVDELGNLILEARP